MVGMRTAAFSSAPVMEISNTDIGNKEFYAKWNANIYAVTLKPQRWNDCQWKGHNKLYLRQWCNLAYIK